MNLTDDEVEFHLSVSRWGLFGGHHLAGVVGPPTCCGENNENTLIDIYSNICITQAQAGDSPPNVCGNLGRTNSGAELEHITCPLLVMQVKPGLVLGEGGWNAGFLTSLLYQLSGFYDTGPWDSVTTRKTWRGNKSHFLNLFREFHQLNWVNLFFLLCSCFFVGFSWSSPGGFFRCSRGSFEVLKLSFWAGGSPRSLRSLAG